MYSWWTISAGRDQSLALWWLKLGPVSLAFYRWFDGEPCFEIHLLNRLIRGVGVIYQT